MKKKYVYIDYLKAIAIFFVVLQHTFAYYVENDGYYTEFAQNMRTMSAYFNVPIFFICAGFLCHKKNIKTFYLEKIKRVLIPFITFAILKLFYSNFISNEYIHGTSITGQLFSSFILGEVYWFCYAILVIYFIAPLMWKEKEEEGITLFSLILGVICIIVSTIIDLLKLEMLPYFQVINAIHYYPAFLFGYIIKQRIAKYEIFERRKFMLFSALCFIVIVSYFSVLWSKKIFPSIYPLNYITFIAVFVILLSITLKMPNNIIVQQLSKYSLQIMFFDSFYKAILFSTINRVMPLTLWEIIPVAALDIFLCVSTCKIIEKIPHVKKIIGL